MVKKYLTWLGVSGDLLECCTLEMLSLCLKELSKVENRGLLLEQSVGLQGGATYEGIRNKIFTGRNKLSYRLLGLVGYWSNDLEELVVSEVKANFPDSPLASCSLEANINNNNTAYDKIYEWLKCNYGLDFDS